MLIDIFLLWEKLRNQRYYIFVQRKIVVSYYGLIFRMIKIFVDLRFFGDKQSVMWKWLGKKCIVQTKNIIAV